MIASLFFVGQAQQQPGTNCSLAGCAAPSISPKPSPIRSLAPSPYTNQTNGNPYQSPMFSRTPVPSSDISPPPSLSPVPSSKPSSDPSPPPSLSPVPSSKPSSSPSSSSARSPPPSLSPVPSSSSIRSPPPSLSPIPSSKPSSSPPPSSKPNPTRSPKPLNNTYAGTLRYTPTNTSQFRNPTYLQQIQSGLSCAIQMPLDNILLTNITTATGTIPFNTTAVNQRGGVAPCPMVRRLRILQQSSNDVTVSYIILSSDTLNITELQDLIASSPAILATGVTTLSAPPAPASTVASSSNNNLLVYVMAPIGTLMALGLFAVAIAIVRSSGGTSSPLSKSSKVVVFVENPTTTFTKPQELEERQEFEPQRIRI